MDFTQIAHFFILLVLLNLLLQTFLIFKYVQPFFIQWSTNEKISFYPDTDRIVSFSLLVIYLLNLNFSKIILENDSINTYLIVLYIIIIICLTFFSFLLFSYRKKAVAKKTQSTMQFVKTENLQKDKHSYNEWFNEKQLTHLYLGLQQYSIVSIDLSHSQFLKDFLSKPLELNLTGIDLYYFHSLIQSQKNKDKDGKKVKITIKDFISFFLGDNGSSYNYVSVRQGSDKERSSDKAIGLKSIFSNFPE